MTFARVNTLGWALFEELTSAQMNQLDIDHANAVDGLNGGGYGLLSDLTFTGAKFSIASIFQAPGANMWNVVFFGADPTGVADSTAAIQAANDAAETTGGWVWFPPGSYKHNSTLFGSPGVSWRGVANATFININHATLPQLVFNQGASGKLATTFEGLSFGALVDNTGNAVFNDAGNMVRVTFRNCAWNETMTGSSPLLKGKLLSLTGPGSQFEYHECTIIEKGTTNAVFQLNSNLARLRLYNCTMVQSIAAAFQLVAVEDGTFETYGTYYDATLHTGSSACLRFVSVGDYHIVHGNTFRTLTSSGPAMVFESGVHVTETGSTFATINPYAVNGLLAEGSELSLGRALSTTSSATGNVQCSHGYRAQSFKLTSTHSGLGPSMLLPDIYFIGQEYEVTVWNNSGSTWTNGVAFDAGVGDGAGNTTNGQARAFRFRAMDVKDTGTPMWVMMSDPPLGDIPP